MCVIGAVNNTWTHGWSCGAGGTASDTPHRSLNQPHHSTSPTCSAVTQGDRPDGAKFTPLGGRGKGKGGGRGGGGGEVVGARGK